MSRHFRWRTCARNIATAAAFSYLETETKVLRDVRAGAGGRGGGYVPCARLKKQAPSQRRKEGHAISSYPSYTLRIHAPQYVKDTGGVDPWSHVSHWDHTLTFGTRLISTCMPGWYFNSDEIARFLCAFFVPEDKVRSKWDSRCHRSVPPVTNARE